MACEQVNILSVETWLRNEKFLYTKDEQLAMLEVTLKTQLCYHGFVAK